MAHSCAIAASTRESTVRAITTPPARLSCVACGRADQLAVVDGAHSREIATREGARAIVDSEIVRLGTSYVPSARLVSSLDGQELATFRETARDGR